MKDSKKAVKDRLSWIHEVYRDCLYHGEEGLLLNYDKPSRFFHNLDHIHWGMSIADKYATYIRDPRALYLAWIYHDLIYDPRALDNEEWSYERLRETYPRSDTSWCRSAILATKKGHDKTGDPDIDLMLDMDMSILGMGDNIFNSYRAAIRLEYAHVPLPVFNIGSLEFFEKLSTRKIFHTKHLAHMEDQAHLNIDREMSRLREEIKLEHENITWDEV